METIRVKPQVGVNVFLEDGSGHVDSAGQEVPLSRYYRRRLRDGDLIKVDAESPVEATANPSTVTGTETESEAGQ